MLNLCHYCLLLDCSVCILYHKFRWTVVCSVVYSVIPSVIILQLFSHSPSVVPAALIAFSFSDPCSVEPLKREGLHCIHF